MLGLLAFLLFETGVAGIPESIAGQVAFLSSLGEDWLIRILALVLGFVLALVAIGPYRVQAWTRWALERQADQPEASSATKPEAQETASASTQPPEASVQRFSNRVRQKFLNLYMDRSERLQKENEQLRAQGEAPQEKGQKSSDGESTNPQ